MKSIFKIDTDKPHRCPRCHTITDPEQKANAGIVQCCWCGALFTRRPRIARVLPDFGVVCDHVPGHPTAVEAADHLKWAEGLLERVVRIYETTGRLVDLPVGGYDVWEQSALTWHNDYAEFLESRSEDDERWARGVEERPHEG